MYDTAAGEFVGFGEMADRAASADVVVFGELHDDPVTHRLERALLEALARRRARVVLSLEMFERDVQPVLDAYLAGRITEAEFLDAARPWPNYPTDYRPLVEFARARGWPVLAANVPQHLASRVAREGLGVLDTLPPDERALAAREIRCPRDAYYERFLEAMGVHPGVAPHAGARTERFYEAQCLRDETMAETIARALAAEPDRLVVHVTGAFHADYGLGTPARVSRRVPDADVVIVSAVPRPTLPDAPVERGEERADYVLYTRSAASSR